MSRRLTEAPKVGSRWRDARATFASSNPRDYIIRVMGVVEGYVVARRTGCAPFLTSVRDWPKKFDPAGRAALQENQDAQ